MMQRGGGIKTSDGQPFVQSQREDAGFWRMIARVLRIEARGVSAHKNFRPPSSACCCWLGTSSGRRGRRKVAGIQTHIPFGGDNCWCASCKCCCWTILGPSWRLTAVHEKIPADAEESGWQLGFQASGQSENDHQRPRLKLTSSERSGSTGRVGRMLRWMDYLPPEHVHALRWRENRDANASGLVVFRIAYWFYMSNLHSSSLGDWIMGDPIVDSCATGSDLKGQTSHVLASLSTTSKDTRALAPRPRVSATNMKHDLVNLTIKHGR